MSDEEFRKIVETLKELSAGEPEVMWVDARVLVDMGYKVDVDMAEIAELERLSKL